MLVLGPQEELGAQISCVRMSRPIFSFLMKIFISLPPIPPSVAEYISISGEPTCQTYIFWLILQNTRSRTSGSAQSMDFTWKGFWNIMRTSSISLPPLPQSNSVKIYPYQANQRVSETLSDQYFSRWFAWAGIYMGDLGGGVWPKPSKHAPCSIRCCI